LAGEFISAITITHITSNSRDRGDTDTRVLVNLSIRHAAFQPLDDGPTIRHGLKLCGRAEVAKERPTLFDGPQSQDGLIEVFLGTGFLPR
jgi:hypothetical protein